MPKPTVIPAPDKKHKAVLTHLREDGVDQGPCSLTIDGLSHPFENRVFGKVGQWSPDSRFLAVQEWEGSGEAGPPEYYRLLIIDVVARRECLIANMVGSKGNILPEGFIGNSVMYTAVYYGQFGITKNFESEFQYLDGWQTLK
jgi:hypothetical protein